MADGTHSEQAVYLHGDLALHVIEARSLPNMDLCSEHLRSCFPFEALLEHLCSCFASESRGADNTRKSHGRSTGAVRDRNIRQHKRIMTSDPYVAVCVPQATLARSRVITNSQHPVWDEHFSIALAHPVVNLEFQVKDDDMFGAEVIGTVSIPAQKIVTGEHITGWFPVLSANGEPPKADTALKLDMKFVHCDDNPLYKHGIADDPEKLGVRGTYFPVRKGGHVTLYQDAHVPEGMLPEIQLDNGKVYKQPQCWEDICYAISEAHHMIYVVGWSIYDKIKLIREPTRPLPRGGDLTLGELLKYKSQEGVRVLMLVWDDKTSHDKFFINTQGLMGTHDEETRKFFKNSSVICQLAPRYASSKLGLMKQQIVGTIFTHHQKNVLVDTQAMGNYRKITAFVGGLDLCDGRYDTPEHRLIRDLDTVFKDDFHNPTFSDGTKGPRQPWHDLHSKIEGPAAYDVLVNFEQRWKKATKWEEFSLFFKRKSNWHDDALIKIERISWIISPEVPDSKNGSMAVPPKNDPVAYVTKEDDSETWHTQIFRSIDSGSLKGFPKTVGAAKSQVKIQTLHTLLSPDPGFEIIFHCLKHENLICSKDMAIDRSIQTAYIQAIRSAQHFIYIENQYFIGSSYAWPSYKDAGADNLIPIELALKIASKIRAKERFAVYIVIPLWPEGIPTSGSVQEVLFWQSQTIEMMYGIVARELKTCELSDSHPLDYLNFYCLGNRENIPLNLSTEGIPPDAVKISDSYKFQRFMIYVHAKGLVVDDEYVIVGSANINQRSMAGTKDTEIAMGSYQPHHTWMNKKRPRGQVYGYRMSLWAEHLGGLDKVYEYPRSLECVKRVNDTAITNWKRFTDENYEPLEGHLLKYPLQVTADGKLEPMPGHENFPDVGGKVIGAHSLGIPDQLTT